MQYEIPEVMKNVILANTRNNQKGSILKGNIAFKTAIRKKDIKEMCT